jgi:hypothetical protein
MHRMSAWVGLGVFASIAATAGCSSGSQNVGFNDPKADGGASAAAEGGGVEGGGSEGGGGAPIPPGAKRAFVTSTGYSANLGSAPEAGGATGARAADAICQFVAQVAHLSGTWKAFVQEGSTTPEDRIPGNGPWYQLDGTLIFDSRSNLLTTPLVPFQVNERGQAVTRFVWIGMPGANCAEWSSTADVNTNQGFVGGSEDWREAVALCSYSGNGLYCFEI